MTDHPKCNNLKHTLRKPQFKKTHIPPPGTPVFIAALFTIARTGKEARCPLTDEWIKKLWYLYTMKYCSAIEWNEIGSFVGMRMNLEFATQSRVRPEGKNKHHILMPRCGISKNGTDESIGRAGRENGLWTQRGKNRVGQIERAVLTYNV